MNEHFEVSRTIPVDAATIFRTITSPAGHVAIDASGMLQGFTGDAATEQGDTFVVHMDRESLGDVPLGKYDVIVTFTAFEQDRFVTWEVSGANRPSFGHYYGYRLEPTGDGGTVVTSIYDWSKVVDERVLPLFPVIHEPALKATLGILERTVKQTT